MKKVLCLFAVTLLLLSGCSVKRTKDLTDAEKFAAEFSIEDKNPFKYASIDEVLEILQSGTGIIFFGDSDCEWCVENVNILNDSLMSQDIEKVYYYNPKSLMKDNPKKYKKLVKLLGNYLEKDNNNEKYLFLPDTYFVREGEVIAHNNDLATMSNTIDSLTSKTKKTLKSKYVELIDEYNSKECTNC